MSAENAALDFCSLIQRLSTAMTLHWQTLAFAELSLDQLYALMRLRQQVFVVEQRCAYLDLDNLDHCAVHMLATQQRELVAYQRCLAPGQTYAESSIGRVVVSPDMRGRQLGRELVQRGIEYNLSQWPQSDICISAQAHLQALYASLGFIAEGTGYLEDNIPHQKMRYRRGA
jgi:ElaA protein